MTLKSKAEIKRKGSHTDNIPWKTFLRQLDCSKGMLNLKCDLSALPIIQLYLALLFKDWFRDL